MLLAPTNFRLYLKRRSGPDAVRLAGNSRAGGDPPRTSGPLPFVNRLGAVLRADFRVRVLLDFPERTVADVHPVNDFLVQQALPEQQMKLLSRAFRALAGRTRRSICSLPNRSKPARDFGLPEARHKRRS